MNVSAVTGGIVIHQRLGAYPALHSTCSEMCHNDLPPRVRSFAEFSAERLCTELHDWRTMAPRVTTRL